MGVIQGPVFTDIQPRDLDGDYTETLLVPALDGLNGTRQLVLSTFDQFREGQTLFLELRVELETPGVTALLLQPWWLRPQQEFRAIGPTIADFLPSPPGKTSVDEHAFGTPGASLTTTERLWLSDQIRQPRAAPGFATVPDGYCYNYLLDNVWVLPIDSAQVGPGFTRTKGFHWPVHGYALAFTSDYLGDLNEAPTVYLSWKTGATHSITQQD